MGDNFLKIKKKYLIVAIIASVVLGAFCGTAFASVLAVILKRCAINLHWAVYIPIALVLGAGSGVGFFFVLRPRDVRLAKSLDSQYALGQKVQTMVEYRSVENEMAVLQREQADGALSTAVKKRIDSRFLLKFLAVPIIAVGVLFAGIFVPLKKTTLPPPPPFDITEYQTERLKNLIADVQASELEDGLKADFKLSLETLLDTLQTTELQSEMKSHVIDTVKTIDEKVASSNSYLTLYNQFKSDALLLPLATAIAKGMTSYKPYVSEVTTLEQVGEKNALNLETLDAELKKWRTSFANLYRDEPVVEGEVGPLKDIPAAKTVTDSYYNAIINGMTTAFGEDSNTYDSLCKSVYDFAVNIYSESTDGVNDTQTYLSSITNVDGSDGGGMPHDAVFSENCKVALDRQSYSCIMDEYIRNALADIFGLSVSEFGSNDLVVPDFVDEGGSGSDDPEQGGAGGSGQTSGIKDLIFDPEQGKYVSCLEVIEKYIKDTNEIIKKFEEISNSEDATAEEKAEAKYVLEELYNYITQYFDLLKSGS